MKVYEVGPRMELGASVRPVSPFIASRTKSNRTQKFKDGIWLGYTLPSYEGATVADSKSRRSFRKFSAPVENGRVATSTRRLQIDSDPDTLEAPTDESEFDSDLDFDIESENLDSKSDTKKSFRKLESESRIKLTKAKKNVFDKSDSESGIFLSSGRCLCQ